MSIIHRYLVKEILKFFCVVIIAVISIYLAVDFIERIGSFMRVQLPLSRALSFFCYKTPFIVAQIMPVAVLLAILVTFGLMSKNNELVALTSSGIHPAYLIKPIVAIGVLSSIFLFIFSEAVVPLAMSKANYIWLNEVKKKKVDRKTSDIWIKEPQAIVHVAHVVPEKKVMRDLTLFYFDETFKLVRRVDAKSGSFSDGKWRLLQVMNQTRDPATGEFKAEFLAHTFERLPFIPDDLIEVAKKPEEMTFTELHKYVQKVEAEGYDATVHRVNLWAKTAYPWICLILALIGTGIAARKKKREKEGIAVAISAGIGISFLYWIFYSVCLSFGHGGMLPPMIAAWAANLVFLSVGIFLLTGVE